MLNQIIVASPVGPCFVYRNYDEEEKQQVDPQLLSAMISVESSGNVKLSTITQILENEDEENSNYAMEINSSYNYITCAVSSNHADSHKLRSTLPKINQMIYEMLGNPYNIFSIDDEDIEKMENRIDLIMIKEGFVGG